MLFGKRTECRSLILNDAPISFVDKCKYLGIIVTSNSGKFSATIETSLSNFYRSSNTILNVLNRPSELISMHLLYSICVPNLTYACEVRDLSSRDMSRIDVALNDAIRKIFTFHRWESTRFLRRSLGYDSASEIYAKRKSSFRHKLQFTSNPVLMYLSSFQL